MSAAAKFFLTLLLAVILVGCATTPTDIRRRAVGGDDNAALRIEPQLTSPDPAVREAVIAELVKMPSSEEAMNALARATLSGNATLRGEAGAAIVLNSNEDLAFFGITLVADTDPSVRKQIAIGLTDAGRAGPLRNTQRASIYLWGLTQDENAEVRAAAAEGVGELGLDDPIDFALTSLRKDADPRVRAAAARGLGTLARTYLANLRGQKGKDAQAVKLPNQDSQPNSLSTPVQTRGEEIVAALCEAAHTDEGHYVDVSFEKILLITHRVEETRWVAMTAAEALTIPGKTPRADVAAAMAAAKARLPATPPPLRPHYLLFHHPGSTL